MATARSLEGVERLGVAFSGGADSSLLLALAAPGSGRAACSRSSACPRASRPAERRRPGVAGALGARLVGGADPRGRARRYRRNGPDRCFHCKDELFTRIEDEVAAALRLTAVAYGENADDVLPARTAPARRAAREHGVLRPWSTPPDQGDVRRSPGCSGCRSADKPAAPCLASRIPHFTEVTARPARRGRGGRGGRCTTSASPSCGCATTAPWRGSSSVPTSSTGAAEPGVARPSSAAVRAPGSRRSSSTRAACAPARSPSTASASGAAWPRLTARSTGSPSSTLDRVARRRGTPRPSSARARRRAGRRASPRGCADDPRPRPPCSPAPRRSTPPRSWPSSPTPVHDPNARLLAWPPAPRPRPAASSSSCRAGTSDLPVAREAPLTARTSGARRRPSSTSGSPACTGCSPGWTCCAAPGSSSSRRAWTEPCRASSPGSCRRRSSPCPTSVGYGAAFGGIAPLLSMLNACAPGVAVVNIDNGYGAGHLAAQIAAP